MKKLLLFFLLLLFVFFSCHKENRPSKVNKSAFYKKAESFLYKQNDSAFYYFNKAANTSKDSLQTAMAYNYMSLIQSDAGDYFGAQESLFVSLKFLDSANEKDFRCLSSDYNELGLGSLNLQNYPAAIDFFDLAIKFSKVKKFLLIFVNNKALAYQQNGNYVQALKLYSEILPHTDQQETYARVLTNMAATKWLQHPGYDAAPELIKALQIRKKANDNWGQNSSFANLATYYGLSNPDSALIYARLMYHMAGQINSPDDRLHALRKLIELSPDRDAKRYFLLYRQLNDSLQTARNASKNQFAIIRYNAEKSKGDNLRLQKDNTEKKYELIKQSIVLYSIVLLFVSAAITATIWYRKRKRQLAGDAHIAIQESKLKTSKKVHDVVANGLYRIMTEIENLDSLNKEHLLDKIEDMYEKSRDISYDQEPAFTGKDFHDKVTELLNSFATDTVQVVYAGNRENLWDNVSENAKYEIGYILQELMINMKKHSTANSVALRFEKDDATMNIFYTDNGVGLPNTFHYKNGLTNTGNRIKSIQGDLTFDNKVDKGVKIKISFPILKS